MIQRTCLPRSSLSRRLCFFRPSATATTALSIWSLSATSAATIVITPPFVTLVRPMSSAAPSLPFRYGDSGNDNGSLQKEQHLLNLEDLTTRLQAASNRRQAAFEAGRTVQLALLPIRNEIGTADAADALQSVVQTLDAELFSTNAIGMALAAAASEDTAAAVTTNRTPRDGNLSYVVEDLVRLAAYQHFLTTGKLLPPPSSSSSSTTTTAPSSVVDFACVTDEEYLGAVMGLCQDLATYGLGRATVRDVTSVQAATRLVTAIHDYLLQFDFRNGPLRRKYDGCKYAVKALETLLYELAVTNVASSRPSTSTNGGEEGEPTEINPKEDQSLQGATLLPLDDLESLRQRLVVRDDLRESLIKQCRDGQKAAKQAVYCLHRGDKARAAALMNDCATLIQTQLWPIVQQEPPLRHGSFAAVVEEYVEAKLFYTWLHGKDDTDATTTSLSTASSLPCGLLLKPSDFEPEIMAIEADEYLGGLCDLTGEIGRFAVARGTARDVVGVQCCWRANSSIARALEALSTARLLPNSHLSKKVDTVKHSVQKLERMLYELSLSQATGGGRTIQSQVVYTDADAAATNETLNDNA